jgi:hypothetical protein
VQLTAVVVPLVTSMQLVAQLIVSCLLTSMQLVVQLLVSRLLAVQLAAGVVPLVTSTQLVVQLLVSRLLAVQLAAVVVPLVTSTQLVVQLVVSWLLAVQLAAVVVPLVTSMQLVVQLLGALLPLCSFLVLGRTPVSPRTFPPFTRWAALWCALCVTKCCRLPRSRLCIRQPLCQTLPVCLLSVLTCKSFNTLSRGCVMSPTMSKPSSTTLASSRLKLIPIGRSIKSSWILLQPSVGLLCLARLRLQHAWKMSARAPVVLRTLRAAWCRASLTSLSSVRAHFPRWLHRKQRLFLG